MPLLDEPTSALDLPIQVQILELLRKLKAEARLPIIMISQDLRAIRAICGEAMVMLQGRVVARGSSGKIFSPPQASYTKQLVAATPTLGS